MVDSKGLLVPPRLSGSPALRLGLFRRLLREKGAALGAAFICAMLLLSYFAPVLANNKPLVITYDGVLRFTAFRDLFPFRFWLRPDSVALKLQQDPDWLLNQNLLKDPKIAALVLPPVPYSPYQTRLDDLHARPSLAPRHFFGCDDSGRDVLSRMLHGAKVSLLVGFLAVGVALLIGVALGALAGFAGGWVDAALVSPLVEVMMCFPGFFFILTVVAVMDVRFLNVWTVMLIIGLTSWPGMARFARAEFLRLRGAEFVVAARSIGASPVSVAVRHVLPNALAPLLVNAAFGIAYAVLMEASLSFLGVGVQPPEPSWGNILNQVTKYWDEWWLGVFPGAAVFCAVLSYNLLGEGLRDALDPRQG